MNRRSFFTKLGLAAASIAILPAATTYARKWIAPAAESNLWVPNPAWKTAPLEVAWITHNLSVQTPIYDRVFLDSFKEPLTWQHLKDCSDKLAKAGIPTMRFRPDGSTINA